MPAWMARARSATPTAVLQKPVLQKRGWTAKDLKGRLTRAQLPSWWVAMLLGVAAAAMRQPVLASARCFSGQGRLSAAIEEFVGPAATFEIEDDATQDLLSITGLKQCMTLVLRLQKMVCCGWGRRAPRGSYSPGPGRGDRFYNQKDRQQDGHQRNCANMWIPTTPWPC